MDYARIKTIAMFRNYLKTAWRNMFKHRTVAYVSIGGLVIGITAVLLIAIYIESELSYDNFHAAAKDIYRVGFITQQQGIQQPESPEFTAPFSIEAKNSFPEIVSNCRISVDHEAWLGFEDKHLKATALIYADSTFPGFFSFALLSGDPAAALKDPYSIVLSQALALKIFGARDVMGKTLSVDGKTNYQVTGVIQDPPSNSTIRYDAIISFSTLYLNPDMYMDWNGGWQYEHYLRLAQGASATGLEKKMRAMMQKRYNDRFAGSGRTDAYLEPLTSLHLYHGPQAGRIRNNMYVFAAVALLILFVSCTNYLNFSVAKAFTRFKEVTVRKVLGASAMQLAKQFMAETILVVFSASLLAVGLCLLLLPLYHELSGTKPALREFVVLLAGVLVLLLTISLAAGSYLSAHLSRLSPAGAMKSMLPASGGQVMGKVLLMLQFAISMALLCCVFVVQMQMRYIHSKPLGFDKEKILVLPLTGDKLQDKASLLKKQVMALSGVQTVSAMSEIPYSGITQNGFLPEGFKDYMMIHQLDGDQDLPRTLRLQVLQGRYFSGQDSADADAYVINRALSELLGWKDPVGKTISRNGNHRVIGVVNDFHFASLHDRIEPLIITAKPAQNRYGFLAVKYDQPNPGELISQVQSIWKQNLVSANFEYWFLDEAFDKMYKSEERFRQLFFYFSVLSITLSLGGVFGLLLLMLQQKTKEIGVRKILGAGMLDIVRLTTGQFLRLIVLASLIAIPAAWFYTTTWLQHFAYRIELRWWMFALCSASVLVFALLVMSLQTIKAATAKPASSLRSE